MSRILGFVIAAGTAALAAIGFWAHGIDQNAALFGLVAVLILGYIIGVTVGAPGDDGD